MKKGTLVHDLLIDSAGRFPEKDAVVQPGRRTTYGEILGASTSLASWLASTGVNVTDRVAVLMDNPTEYVISYFAVLMAGGTVVPLSTETSPRDLDSQLNNCEVSVLLTAAKFMKQIGRIPEPVATIKAVAVSGLTGGASTIPYETFNFDTVVRSSTKGSAERRGPVASDIAQIINTSGTTGSASAVMLRHSNLIENTGSIVQYLKLDENDKVMAVLPFFYSYGNSLLLTHFAVGGTLVVNQSFLYPNVVLDMMQREEVTGFSGVPSTFAILLNRSALRSYKFPSLRYITQAGGAMSPKLAEELHGIFPEVELFIMYGQTEASARLSYLEPKELLRKAGSIGKAIPGVNLEVSREDGTPAPVGEVGEIVASGGNIMAGYMNDPEKTACTLKGGRLWTGDLARVDEEGFLYIVSRKSDIIKCGGHRICPKEIEEVLLEHPAVHEPAVVGLADEILGESVAAYVVLKDDAGCTATELLGHCQRELPPYKVPHKIVFIDELPKTASGKIKKGELKPRTPSDFDALDPRVQ